MINRILERLEEEREIAYADFDKYARDYELDLDDTYDDLLHKGLERAKTIVQEVAKEYGNASDNELEIVSALPSLYPMQPFEEEAIHKVVASAKDGRWISAEKELPSNGTYLYVTCHSHIDDDPDWVAHSFYFNDKWGIPLVDCGKAEVIAWMEEKSPTPYQKEVK